MIVAHFAQSFLHGFGELKIHRLWVVLPVRFAGPDLQMLLGYPRGSIVLFYQADRVHDGRPYVGGKIVGPAFDSQRGMGFDEGGQPSQLPALMWQQTHRTRLRRTFGEHHGRASLIRLEVRVDFQAVTMAGFDGHLQRVFQSAIRAAQFSIRPDGL